MPLNLIFKGNTTTIQLDISADKKIDFTGPREIAKIDIPGFKPQYQDMGQGERSAKWNGIIQQEGALVKAESLRSMMDEGREITFIYGEINVKVLIQEFNYQYYRDNYIRYDITLTEVEHIDTSGLVDMPQALKAKPGGASGGQVQAFDLVPTLLLGIIQGDNLRSISTKMFGTPHHWKYIAKINGINGASIPLGKNQVSVPTSMGALLNLKSLLDKRQLPVVNKVYAKPWQMKGG